MHPAIVASPEDPGGTGLLLEQVLGTLAGREGTFVLQHLGVSYGGNDRLMLEVLPGSGTGALAGLTGKMTIWRGGGKHSYTLDYTL